MAWYNTMGYKTDAERYLEWEAERKRQKELRESWKNSIVNTQSKAYKSFAAAEEKRQIAEKERLSTYFNEPPYFTQPEARESLLDMTTYTHRDYMDEIRKEYENNIKNYFPDLKKPDFSKTKKEKTEKPRLVKKKEGEPEEDTEKLLMLSMGITPVKKKVYKYKRIDPNTEAEIIIPQIEIEIAGENQDNYYYYKNGQLASIKKDEVSESKLDEEELELRYMRNINEMTKLLHPRASIGEPTGELIEAKPDPRTVQEFLKQGVSTAAGMLPEKVQEFGKGAIYGFGKGASAPLERVGDIITKKAGPYAHDEEVFKEQKFKLKDGKLTPEDMEKIDKQLEKYKKAETKAYPKGFSKETDVKAAGGTKEEILAAKIQDEVDEQREYFDERPLWQPSTAQDIGKEIGKIAGIIYDTAILSFIPGLIAGSAGITVGGAGILKPLAARVVTNAINGGSFGFLTALEERDPKALDIVKKTAQESAFMIAGGEAGAVTGKVLGPAKSFKGEVIKRTIKAGVFGSAGEGARTPFLPKEERTLRKTVERILTSAVFSMGLEGAFGKYPRVPTKSVNSKLSEGIISKFGLNMNVKKFSSTEKNAIAEAATIKILKEVGKKVGKKVGSLKPKDIVNYYQIEKNISGKVKIQGDLTGNSNFAKVEAILDDTGKNFKEITIRYNKSKSSEEIAGAIRHEIAHLEDVMSGAKKTVSKLIKRPKTLFDLISRKGHHKGAENWELKYLDDILEEAQYKKSFKTGPEGPRQFVMKEETEVISPERRRVSLEETGEPYEAEMSIEQRQRELLKSAQPRSVVDLGTDNITVHNPVKMTKTEKAKTLAKIAYEKFVDEQYIFSKVGESTKITGANYNRYHSTASHIQTEKLVGRDGRVLDERNLLDFLDAGKHQGVWDDYLKLKLHWERLASKKPILFKNGKALSGKDTEAKIKEIERNYPELQNWSDELYTWLDKFAKEYLVNGHLVPADIYRLIRFRYKHYIPLEKIMPGGSKAQKFNRIAAKALQYAKGGPQDMEPIAYSLPRYVQKLVRLERKNSIYLSIAENTLNARGALDDMVRFVDPGKIKDNKMENALKELNKSDKDIGNILDSMEESLVSVANKGNFLIALEKGKPIVMKIENQSLWKLLNKMQNSHISDEAQILKVLRSPQNLFKAVTTKYNPVFFLYRNILRDIPTAYIQGSVKKPVTFAANLGKSAADIVKSTGMYKKITGFSGPNLYENYKALGGKAANFLATEKKLTPNKAQKLLEYISAIGNGLESMPRYAEFKYVYNKYKPMLGHKRALDKAIYQAAEVTTNFSRRAPYTKFADAFVPFFNAKVQGFDKTIRTAIKHPASTLLKTLGVVTLPTSVFYVWNKMVDPENYDNLPDYVKDRWYVVPLGDGEFWKVPKNHAYGLAFGTMFERMFRLVEGQPDAFKGLGPSVIEQIPLPQELITSNFYTPLAKLLVGANKDYFGRDIVPMYMLLDERSPGKQADERTSWGAKVLGESLDWSPKKMDFFIKSYLGVVASLYFAFATRDGTIADVLGTTGFTASASYGKKERAEYLEETESKRNLKDFEIDVGITEIRKKARQEGITSTTEINRRIWLELSPSDYSDWEELKKKKKELQGD